MGWALFIGPRAQAPGGPGPKALGAHAQRILTKGRKTGRFRPKSADLPPFGPGPWAMGPVLARSNVRNIRVRNKTFRTNPTTFELHDFRTPQLSILTTFEPHDFRTPRRSECSEHAKRSEHVRSVRNNVRVQQVL